MSSSNPDKDEAPVEEGAGSTPSEAGSSPEGTTEGDVSERIRAQVQELLDENINPSVASHGGVISLLDVQGTRVFLQMGGGCQGCGMAQATLKQGVEALLREQVPELTEILDTTDHAAGNNPYYQG